MPGYDRGVITCTRCAPRTGEGGRGGSAKIELTKQNSTRLHRIAKKIRFEIENFREVTALITSAFSIISGNKLSNSAKLAVNSVNI